MKKHITRVKKLNESLDNVNSTKVTELWVVQTHNGSDIQNVFTKIEDAEVEKDRYTKECYDHYRNINKRMTDKEFEEYFSVFLKRIKVINLEDAIENRVDDAIDNATMHGPEY